MKQLCNFINFLDHITLINGGRQENSQYALLVHAYVFVPIAVETKYTVNTNSDGLKFLGYLGRHISQVTDDIRESALLLQSLSVHIQRYNVVAIQGTFAHTTSEDEF